MDEDLNSNPFFVAFISAKQLFQEAVDKVLLLFAHLSSVSLLFRFLSLKASVTSKRLPLPSLAACIALCEFTNAIFKLIYFIQGYTVLVPSKDSLKLCKYAKHYKLLLRHKAIMRNPSK